MNMKGKKEICNNLKTANKKRSLPAIKYCRMASMIKIKAYNNSKITTHLCMRMMVWSMKMSKYRAYIPHSPWATTLKIKDIKASIGRAKEVSKTNITEKRLALNVSFVLLIWILWNKQKPIKLLIWFVLLFYVLYVFCLFYSGSWLAG